MRLPGPTDVVKLAGQGYDAAERAMSLVPRLFDIVGDVEQVMVRVHALLAAIAETNTKAAAVVDRTERVVVRAEGLVGAGELLVGAITPLALKFLPVLDRVEPMIARIADTTSPDEVDAVVKLIDTLPELSEKLRSDILPVLDTLGTVAPDLRDLLDSSKDLNEMLAGLPGLGRVKRRIEERQQAQDSGDSGNSGNSAKQYSADEAPPSAPVRGHAPAEEPGAGSDSPEASPQSNGAAAGGQLPSHL